MKKVYLITGATSDVGVALIKRIIEPGDTVIAQGAGDLERLDGLRREHEGQIAAFDVDLTDPEAVGRFVREAGERFDTPTHLVHLPALRVVNTKFKNFDFERFELDLNVQVKSALALCNAFVPRMAKARFGRVLFMQTSYTLGMPPKFTTAYVVTKSAIGGLVKSLAADFAGTGVTVNCVAPSMMETRFLADTSSLIVEAAAAANPMGRNATPDDVVPAMAFLLSEEARFITGVTLPVTGGSAL